MIRAVMMLAVAASLSALTIWATAVGPAVGRTAERGTLLVEPGAPRVAILAISIL
ncbi:MAG: hypothetical protein M3Q88_01125 [Pseudomonadota bacterium]|nr:hypothetical protein [Pseudomonadota bacterium]